MDKFTALEPVRLYNSSAPPKPSPRSTSSSNRLSLFSPLTPRQVQPSPFLNASRQRGPAPFERIGRLPADLHILVLTSVAVPDLPAYARACRATGALVRDERVWEARWRQFGLDDGLGDDVQGYGKEGKARGHLHEVLEVLEERSRERNGLSKVTAPPTLTVDIGDDDFGDFASGGAVLHAPAEEMGDFVGAFNTPRPDSSFPAFTTPPTPSKPTYRAQYIRVHTLLRPLVPALYAPPHAVLSTLFPPPTSPTPSPFQSPLQQAHLLRLLALFLSPRVKPLRSWSALSAALRAATDRFEDALLTAFDVADGRFDETGMREAAEASWEVFDRSGGEGSIPTYGDSSLGSPREVHWELGTVWIEKREIFYEQSKWRALDNFSTDGQLDFDAMDAFISEVLTALREHGSRAVRVFPPTTAVLLSFADRLASDVIGEYIAPLLTRAREISSETFLKACAASFKEAWRMVDVIMEVASERRDSLVTKAQAEDVVYRMFEANMDDYLDEETDFVKACFEETCRAWETQLLQHSGPTVLGLQNGTEVTQVRFIGSSNPAQVKRNVLASFADVLLLPVTIVPRTAASVGKAVAAGGSAAVQGIAMLNPQKWGASSANGAGASESGFGKRFSKLGSWRQSRGGSVDHSKNGYTRDFEKSMETDKSTLFEIGDVDEDEGAERNDILANGEEMDMETEKTDQWSVSSSTTAYSTPAPSTLSMATSSTSVTTPASAPLSATTTTTFDKLDLLLSLDVALELIHADRESLKRAETFSGYPGQYGHRVRDTIEEIFVLLLQALSERHVKPGFDTAEQQMRTYQPAAQEETRSVAPLLQFFELVHLGDTIQSMVQVYFDKELAPHIDRTDFLNAVVREKKRFEDALDDSVAAGLNAGTDALMNQVEHIIMKLTGPRAYYPQEGAPLELGPTKGCVEAIQCLKMHCQLLKGSTSKEVLEVFYQEIGIRLIAILQKHLKRQIISLNGGFQVIADLNAYHTFIASLKVSSIAAEFSYLKMLGHVYVVEDAKDLAQIVRDVTRYGGAYKPEDVYEFIQRRADWKRIEKTVDKTMYNLSFKEDCLIC